MVLCLNGYMLKGTGSGSVITINGGATLTICDCMSESTEEAHARDYYVNEDGLWVFYEGELPESAPENAVTGTVTGGVITGGNALCGGGAIYGESKSTLNINGGTFAGNTVSYDGGAIYGGYKNTLNIHGGTFAGNTAKYGGGVDVYGGTFTMIGGTVSGNTATSRSGGVCVNYGTFTMEGGYLGDNTATESGNDIYKDEAGVVSISGGYFSENPDAAYIAGDHTSQDISVLGGALFDFDYIEGFPYAVYRTAEGLTANVSANIVYDGNPIVAGADFTVTGADDLELSYAYKTDGGELIAGLPTNAGTYTVEAAALGADGMYNEAEFSLTIAKATYDMRNIAFEGATVTYDGETHGLAITGTLPAGVSVSYTDNGQVNAGEYTVTATFTGDYLNYNAIPDMTATLTIAKATPAYTAPTELTVEAEGTLADITLPAGWSVCNVNRIVLYEVRASLLVLR